MLAFIAKRLLWAIPVLIGAAMLSFLLIRLVPGDPTETALAGQPLQPAVQHAIRAQFHLDEPAPQQFFRYVSALVHGDLGLSIQTGRSVNDTIGEVIGPTLQLTAVAITVGLALGITGGILGSWIKSRSIDRSFSAAQMIAVSMPSFWVGLMFLTFFSFQLHWFPAAGNEGVDSLVLPALTLALPIGAVIAQLLRASMLEVLREPYIVTARAKGLSEFRVRLGHALRNAMLPVLTYTGVILGTLVTSTVIAETIFSRQGLGRVIVDAVTKKNYPVVQGVVILAAFAYVLINIAVDVVHAALDPRIR